MQLRTVLLRRYGVAVCTGKSCSELQSMAFYICSTAACYISADRQPGCLQVLVLTSSTRVMGTAFVNSLPRKVGGWAGSLVIMVANVVLVWEATTGTHWTLLKSFPVLLGITAYLGFIAYLVLGPKR